MCIMFAANTIHAQSVNGVPLKDLDVPYIMIVGEGKFLSNKIKVEVDFGQKTKFSGSDKKQFSVLDAEGKKVEFNSMIDALNYFHEVGYELVNAYVITVDKGIGGTQNVYHWVLKKKG